MIKKKIKPLTTGQKNKLKEHKKHHTKKHIVMMINEMKTGKSFNDAHKKAQKSVGK